MDYWPCELLQPLGRGVCVGGGGHEHQQAPDDLGHRGDVQHPVDGGEQDGGPAQLLLGPRQGVEQEHHEEQGGDKVDNIKHLQNSFN